MSHEPSQPSDAESDLSESNANVDWGHPGWLSALIDEALERVRSGAVEAVPTSQSGAVLDAWVRARWWSSGVGLGRWHDGGEGPVRAESDVERAFVQNLRFQLAVGASLLPSATPQIRDEGALLASLCAATANSFPVATRLDEAARGHSALDEEEREHLISIAGAALHRRAYLDGNPPDGLPLHHMLAAIETRALVRLVSAHLQGRGAIQDRTHRHSLRLSKLKAGAVELISSLLQKDGALDDEQRMVARRQIRGLHLKPADRHAAFASLDEPRSPEDLLTPLPRRLREAAVEQAAIVSAVELPRVVEWRRRPPHPRSDEREDLEVEDDPPLLLPLRNTLSQPALALAGEIRKNEELGGLLKRAVRGESLTTEERSQFSQMLVGLANEVPDLALLGEPGGRLLLPLLIRVASKPKD